MSKEEWFREYERLEAEHPDKDPEELSEMALEKLIDKVAAQADQLLDEEKER